MRDWLHDILNVVDHDRGTVAGAVIAVAALVWRYGCQSKTFCLDPEKQALQQKVTRAELVQRIALKEKDLAVKKAGAEKRITELQAEVENVTATYKAEEAALTKLAKNAVTDLDGQDETKRQIVATLTAVGTDALNGRIPTSPAGIATTVLGLVGTLVGGGALYHNRRKNKKIEELKGVDRKALDQPV